MQLPVLIYQMDVQFGDPQANMTKVRQMLEQENPEPNTLVVLPELFLTGYDEGAIDQLTSSTNSPYLTELCSLSQQYSISIFGSLPLRIDEEKYNTAFLINNGEVDSLYPKSHLFGPMGEKELFSAGREIPISKLQKSITIGMSICYDLRFPELYSKQSREGAQIFLICAEWPIQRVDHWVSLLKARAIENQSMIIACNRVGDDPDYHYGGNSVIYDSYGNVVVHANDDQEQVIRTSIDTSDLTTFRSNFATAEDRWI